MENREGVLAEPRVDDLCGAQGHCHDGHLGVYAEGGGDCAAIADVEVLDVVGFVVGAEAGAGGICADAAGPEGVEGGDFDIARGEAAVAEAVEVFFGVDFVVTCDEGQDAARACGLEDFAEGFDAALHEAGVALVHPIEEQGAAVWA